MQNQNSPPWYEDTGTINNLPEILSFKPQDYYSILSKSVFNQPSAVKAASLFLYSHINLGIKRNILFSGTTGSGKSWLINQMQKLVTDAFESPNLFTITDATTISSTGYKGDNLQDSYSALKPVYIHIARHPEKTIYPIAVFDEFDKVLAPANMQGTNASGYAKMTMNSFLMALSGCKYTFNQNGKTNIVDTSFVSHCLVGSFQDPLDNENSEKHTSIGFNQTINSSDEPTIRDEDFFAKVLPSELWGRIDDFGVLTEMKGDDYERLLRNPNFIKSFEDDFHVSLHLTENKIKDLAELAESKELGVRTLNKNIKNLIFDTYWKQENSEFVTAISF